MGHRSDFLVGFPTTARQQHDKQHDNSTTRSPGSETGTGRSPGSGTRRSSRSEPSKEVLRIRGGIWVMIMGGEGGGRTMAIGYGEMVRAGKTMWGMAPRNREMVFRIDPARRDLSGPGRGRGSLPVPGSGHQKKNVQQ